MDERPSSFGLDLRRRREAAGLSLGGLALRLHYHKSYLSKIENGVKQPSPQLARRCDAALDAGGALAALAPAPGVSSVNSPDTTANDVWAMRLAANGHGEFGSVDRRDLMAVGGAALAGWIVAPTPAPKRHRAEVLASCQSIFEEIRRLGQTAMPAALLPTVAGLTHALRVLAIDSPPKVHDQALVLAARCAEYAGWMAQEAGSDAGALWWTDRAVELASRGGDDELAAFALIRRALLSLYQHDAIATVALATSAQDGHYRPRIRGLAALREAQGRAIAGDYDQCRWALDRAARQLQQAASDDGLPVLGTSTMDDPVAMVTGWCLYDLGRPAEAAETLERELARVPKWAHRARARFTARYALALTGTGEVEQACAVVEPVLDALTHVDSATIRVDLRLFAQQLTRWHTASAVRRVRPRLTTTLRTTPTSA